MISELENIECTRNSVRKYRRKYALTAKQKLKLKLKNILTEALVNSATNASFIFSYTNSAKLRKYCGCLYIEML